MSLTIYSSFSLLELLLTNIIKNILILVFTAPFGPLDRETDIIFLLDGSRGVSERIYSQQKDFVKALANQFYVSPNGPRASGAAFGEEAGTIVYFNEANFAEKVSRAKLVKTPRRIDRALKHAAKLFITRGRDGPKIVVLLTAGTQRQNPRLLNNAAETLRNLGAVIYVVAIGSNNKPLQLNAITSKTQDIFQVASPDGLPLYVRSTGKASKFFQLLN